MSYNRLSFQAVVQLAAPPTWGASIVPVVLGAALALSFQGVIHPLLFYSLLLTSVLLQCAVNTLNDYADFVKGTDTAENSDDPEDASLVYNGINPKSALLVGAVFIAAATACGIYALVIGGWQLLLFGAAGVAILVLYSFGASPISHLPLGEVVSGFSMGGLIPLACYYAFTRQLAPSVLVYALPVMVSIGLIMFTNNACDIERDRATGRRTLPVLIGRPWTRRLHLLAAALNVLLILVIVRYSHPGGFFLAPLLVLMSAGPAARIYKGGLVPEARMQSMQLVVRLHWRTSLLYIVMIAVSSLR